jgi:hypothetical protein
MNIFKMPVTRMLAVALVAGAAGLGIGSALASQPQMEGALSALRSVEGTLRQVTMYKAGHANRARQLVAEAIGEVEAGIAYGRQHGL